MVGEAKFGRVFFLSRSWLDEAIKIPESKRTAFLLGLAVIDQSDKLIN